MPQIPSNGSYVQWIIGAVVFFLAYLGWYQLFSYFNYALSNSGLGLQLPTIPAPGSPNGNNIFSIIFAAVTALLFFFLLRPKVPTFSNRATGGRGR